MKALKAAKRSLEVTEDAMRRELAWSKFARGAKCPYCGRIENLPEQLPKHMDRCREALNREPPAFDPDFPTLGKPIRSSMRWKVLRKSKKDMRKMERL